MYFFHLFYFLTIALRLLGLLCDPGFIGIKTLFVQGSIETVDCIMALSLHLFDFFVLDLDKKSCTLLCSILLWSFYLILDWTM